MNKLKTEGVWKLNSDQDETWELEDKKLTLTKNELFMINNSITINKVLDIRKQVEDGVREIPLSKLYPNAAVSVDFDIYYKIIAAIASFENYKLETINLFFSKYQLMLLRECCDTRIVYGEENVGENLLIKISKLITEPSLEENMEKLAEDFELSDELQNTLTEIVNKKHIEDR